MENFKYNHDAYHANSKDFVSGWNVYAVCVSLVVPTVIDRGFFQTKHLTMKAWGRLR